MEKNINIKFHFEIFFSNIFSNIKIEILLKYYENFSFYVINTVSIKF